MEAKVLTRRAAVTALSRNWQATRAVPPRAARRLVAIDLLIAWAYREELPKSVPAPALPTMSGGWDAVARWADELSLAGRDPNRFGVIADPLAERLRGAPHPDAFAIHEAVQRLDDCAVALPDDWNPFRGEACTAAHEAALARALDALTAIDGAGERTFWIAAPRGKGGRTVRAGVAGQRVLRTAISELVRRGAIMGSPSRPSVECQAEVVRHANGKPIWFVQELIRHEGSHGDVGEPIETREGWDERRKAPKPGAYQKTLLQPDPVPDLVATAHYELWNAAMGMLVEDLAGKLSAHEAVGLRHCAAPDRSRHAGRAARW